MMNLFFIKGFHLIELLITISLLGILTSIALPSYQQYSAHAKRLEAIVWLNKLALALESYHLQHHTFVSANLKNLGFKKAISDYSFEIKNATKFYFLLAAIPNASQAKHDLRCLSLQLDANFEKSITGYGSISECWGD